MSSIERESKLELSREDFEQLKRSGTVVRCIPQLNVYYGDVGRRADRGAALRIRHVPGAPAIVTVKTPITREDGYRATREYEDSLPIPPDRPRNTRPRTLDVEADLPEEHAECLRAKGITRLRRLGWMRNERWVVRIGEADVELDRTTLPTGEIVYEAEFEHEDEALHRDVVARIRELAPGARPSNTSKSERFFRSIRERARASG